MATAAVTYPAFAVPALADPNQLNQNFDDLVDFLNGDVLHRDGSKVAQGNLDLGGFKLLNVGTGTASTDAVNKAQMDAALAALVPGVQVVSLFPTAAAGTFTTSSTSITQFPNSDATWTAVAGRRYRVSAQIFFTMSTASDVFNISLRDTADAELVKCQHTAPAAGMYYAAHMEHVTTGSLSGSQTFDVAVQRILGSGSFSSATTGSAANGRSMLYIEDVGLL